MPRILKIFTAFTILTCIFVSPANASKDKDKLLQTAAQTAAEHCLKISEKISQHYELVDAYNKHYDIDKMVNSKDFGQKQKMINYMWGRPDIPDFTFVIPHYAAVISRKQAVSFNAIALLRISEALGIKAKAYPFSGNCKTEIIRDESKDEFDYLFVKTGIAIDHQEVSLVYELAKQRKYNWIIKDLVIDDYSLANNHRKELTEAIKQKGIDDVVADLCKKSELPTLKCE